MGGIIDRNSFVRQMVMEISFRISVSMDCCDRSKYGQANNSWDAAHRCNPRSNSWKGISQVLPFFVPFTALFLVCGNIIRYWIDPWVSFMGNRFHDFSVSLL